jgi:SMODS and SLOG-associating 2TM effector domain family 4
MFDLTLVDHLRVTFGHIIYCHRAHAETARSHARWSRTLRVGEALLMAAAAIAAAGVAFGQSFGNALATAILAGLALLLLLADLMLNLDRSAQAHFQCAVRFWGMREKYRALLSDLSDGAIEPAAARRHRDALLEELQSVYESAPVADPKAYQSARQAAAAVEGATLTDEEIDIFLPGSLRKGKVAAS